MITPAWTPDAWRACPAAQLPTYPDPEALAVALAELAALPPLVVAEEVDTLRTFIAEAAAGRRFMLQGGDCAERFADCTPEAIGDKLKVLLQMSVVLSHGARTSVFHVGRIAGQYAKPRSRDTECLDGETLPVYRGDLINGLEATAASRRPDPRRLLAAYFRAAATLNHLRALVDGGFADLHHPERWDLPGSTQQVAAYRTVLERVQESLDFLDSLQGLNREALRTGEIFTSHEALHLPYETALTRRVGRDHYNLGAHMLWVGERTRQLGGAHLAYLRGLRNPLGVKLGPAATPDEVLATLDVLDPAREPGRITLITRCGAERVREVLPPLVRTVKRSGRPVLWSCDPMHGNGITTRVGLKTRDFDAICSELRQAFEVHRAEGTRLGAVHFELTGEHVTECLGGSQGLREEDLGQAYETGCDPRLNHTQSLEMAFLIAEMLRAQNRGGPVQASA